MTKSKKVVQRALLLDQKYEVLSIYRGDFLSGNGTTCENCGKVISNIAEIKNSSNTVFQVGLDCAKTLQISNPDDFSGLEYPFKQVSKFLTLSRKKDSKVSSDGFRAIVNFTNYSKNWGEFTDSFSVFNEWLNRHSPGWEKLITTKNEKDE
jgi:hypothetical protein